MSRRVYELAQDIGLKSRDLAEKINAMGLGFTVNNHMSTITDEQEDTLRRALEREARENMVEERISATVIRRKPRVRRAVAKPVAPTNGPDPLADLLHKPPVTPPVVAEVAPPEVVKESAVVVEESAGAVEEPVAVETAEKTPEAPEEIVVAVAEVETSPTEPVPVKEPAELAEPVGEEVPVEADAGTAAPEEAPVEDVEEEQPSVDHPANEPHAEAESTTEDPETTRPAHADILAALARQKVAGAGPAGRKGAQVVGSLSPELLQQRLAVDKKTFGPDPKAVAPAATGTRETFEIEQAGRRKRKRGKKVYGANELYDNRSSRRRAMKKPVGGQATQITLAAERKRHIRMEEAILVSDLAHQMGVKAGEIALKLMMELGVKGANINTPLDYDSATLIADLYGYSVDQVGFDLRKYLPVVDETDQELVRRPPVVTVMGHVDHGKTSLLDAIRETDVAGGESGGITQHIGAYKVELDSGTVVFLDTPGHEAFTAMRARGAQATDIVILVVAADDGVMPQTVEAVNHSKDAGVPIVVAVNKMDKAGANPERVMQALTEYGLVPEAWGGETLYQEVSAKEGTGVQELLESLVLQAEVLELSASSTRPAEGIVVESRLDIGRGPVATILVRAGTLRAGDVVAVGANWGRVRAMTDERGNMLEEAPPSTPVEITGLDGVPDAGELVFTVDDEKAARTISSHLSAQKRQKELAKSAAAPTDLETLTTLLEAGELKELKLIIKSDVQGSQDALQQALTKLSTAEVAVKIVHTAVGGITESDVNLAASSAGGAIIIGFNVRPETRAQQSAEQLGISLLSFSVIYDAVDTVRNLMTGMLEPVYEESALGKAEVRDVFNIPKIGTIAGCYVLDGTMTRGAKARIVRDSKIIYTSSISSLRRFKDDVKEVKHGFECGLSLENFNDIKVGDVVEVFKMVELEPSLT